MEAKKITDKIRFDLASGNILTSYGDFELKKYQPHFVPGKPTLPAVPGGIFDSNIFGSPYVDRCECGYTTTQGVTCPKCHSHVNTQAEQLSAVGLIKLPFYIVGGLSLMGLVTFLSSNFRVFESITTDLLYTRFVKYDADTNSLNFYSHEETTNPDWTEFSIEGIIKIVETKFKDKLNELMCYVQRYVLVRPVSMRPWSYTYKSWAGVRTLDKHQLNFQYQSLIYISTELMSGLNLLNGSVEDIVYSIASIKLACTKIVDGISGLIKSSKQSSIRQGYSTRIPNSARGTALADPTLDIDSVSLPISMCYEIFRNQFLPWIQDRYKLSESEILDKIQDKSPEMIRIFQEFTSEVPLYAMINRAPTLYKLGQLVFKVKVNNGAYIGYSLMATTPLNLDFDGDTLAVYEVPPHLVPKVESMIPSKLDKYMKSDKEVILPKQENLIGLMIASRIDAESRDLTDTYKFRDLTEAEAEYKKGSFNSYDKILIGDKEVTYGREKLSSIFGFTLDYDINPGNISALISKLKTQPNFVDTMKLMQDFALEVTTYESRSDLSLEFISKSAHKSELPGNYTGDLTDLEVYNELMEMNKDVIPMKDSLSGNLKNIASMTNPQIYHDENGFGLSSDGIINAVSANEYIKMASEQRSVQRIKNNSVGESGYTARQIWTAMSKLTYSDQIVPHQRLLLITPDVDGQRYANGKLIQVKKGVPVLVDSVIYAPDDVVRPNDLYADYRYKDGHLIGIDYGMQISEGTTQGILKLKHEGGYVAFNSSGILTANTDCTVKFDSEYLYINGERFLKSPSFKMVDPNKSEFKKGQLIGINPSLINPNAKLFLLIKLLKTMGSTSIIYKPERYLSVCSANAGTVKFLNGMLCVDSVRYEMPKDSLCIVPEGAHVEIGDRLFTGALDYQRFLNKYPQLGINDVFKIFSNELKSLTNINSILTEFLFKAIHYIDIKHNIVNYRGVVNSIDPKTDLLTSLTLGYIKKKVSEFIASDTTEIGDSNLLNVAYQFEGLKLQSLMTNTNKQISNE